MINHGNTISGSMLLDTVPEEAEENQTSNKPDQVNEKTKSANLGLMRPPLFPPTRMDTRNDRRCSSSSSSLDSSEVSSDSFEFQPPLPNGQYSFITATYRAQLKNNNSSSTFDGSITSQIQSGSFTKSPSCSTTKNSSKALTKGIQLIPVGMYNDNIGTRRMQELQMPAFEALQSRRYTPKAITDQNTTTSQSSSLKLQSSPQSRRHKALKHWWDAEIQAKKPDKPGKPLCAKGCVSPSGTMNDVQDSSNDGIREGFVPFTPNKFFAPPQHIAPQDAVQPPRSLEIESERIKSRLLWEAVQDGLVTLDTILALPLSWGDLCVEHYEDIGLISPTESTRSDKIKGTLTSVYPIENPLTIKARKEMKVNSNKENNQSPALLFKGDKAKIMLQYTK
ncbi:uncharacterized protein FA14DRAFT_162558 [Meira miltonrushii]|uniref:Uncharacterized protein n=1 Tax=Meira miltonrushii TaxID=1280837 RepID=A0A316V1Y2_9BASI|nr:uncharacterized protein FA14DRAFT_162558 [Meira miltonrushii]PWN31557.1 hypothetical protein FA14DRAFT_162558 [Meira miltonrushii]